MKTTQVTLRGIDPKLKKLIDQHARKQKTSINTYVVSIIKQSVGYTKSEEKPWRAYAGTIPTDGISQQALDDFEAVDESMWH